MRRVDEVVTPDTASTLAEAPVRLGIDPEFHPYPTRRSRELVVFAGELSRSTGLFDLLAATSDAGSAPWQLLLVGRGRDRRALERRTAAYGLSHRVTIHPFTTDRAQLAQTFAGAACVVTPGPPERGRLLTLEAAATGTPVVAPEGALITKICPELAHPFTTGDVVSLARAIRAAISSRADPQLGIDLGRSLTWERAFSNELRDLRARVGRD